MYSNSDIYLIDDALSALDADVGSKIMEKVFKKMMLGKTRVMVTHKIKLLKDVDRVILMKDGKIVAQGTYDKIKHTQEYKDYLIAERESGLDLPKPNYSDEKIFRESTKNEGANNSEAAQNAQKIEIMNYPQSQETSLNYENNTSEHVETHKSIRMNKITITNKDYHIV